MCLYSLLITHYIAWSLVASLIHTFITSLSFNACLCLCATKILSYTRLRREVCFFEESANIFFLFLSISCIGVSVCAYADDPFTDFGPTNQDDIPEPVLRRYVKYVLKYKTRSKLPPQATSLIQSLSSGQPAPLNTKLLLTPIHSKIYQYLIYP
jgi:hypothetical protein